LYSIVSDPTVTGFHEIVALVDVKLVTAPRSNVGVGVGAVVVVVVVVVGSGNVISEIPAYPDTREYTVPEGIAILESTSKA